MQHQLQARPAGFHREVPPGESPSEAAARVGAGETHRGGSRAAARQGRGVPGLRLPLFQVLQLSARPGIPPEAPSWWHILLWPSRAEAGQGAGKENKASAPNDVTLSSSKTLAFVFLPSFPVNKFPRAVRANWPESPKSGRDKAVPRLPCSVGAPGASGFHTSRAATARERAGRAQEPAPPQTPTPTALPAGPAPRGPSSPAGQAGPRPQAPAPPARASARRPPASPPPSGRAWGTRVPGRAAGVPAPTSAPAAPPPAAASARGRRSPPALPAARDLGDECGV